MAHNYGPTTSRISDQVRVKLIFQDPQGQRASYFKEQDPRLKNSGWGGWNAFLGYLS